MAKKLQLVGDFTDDEAVKQIVDEYLTDNPPIANITINGKGPDENGNFVINTSPGTEEPSGNKNDVVEF